MNKIRSSLPWSQLIFAFVVFIAVLVLLTFIYQDTLRETVLVSILYVLWVGDLAIQSFDQRCIWLLALVITLVLTITFSRRKTEKPIADSQTTLRRRSFVPGRIDFWRSQVWLGSGAVYSRSYHRSDLHRLVIKALAYRENKDSEEIRELLRSEKLQVPPEVRYILGIENLQRGAEYRLRILHRIQQRFNWIHANFLAPTFSPDPRLDKVAAYLESFIEDDHDV